MVDIDKAPNLLAFDESEDHRRKLREYLDGRVKPFVVLLEKQYGNKWGIVLSYSYKLKSSAWKRYTRLMIWAHANSGEMLQLVKDFVEYQRDGGEFSFTAYVDTIKEQETETE